MFRARLLRRALPAVSAALFRRAPHAVRAASVQLSASVAGSLRSYSDDHGHGGHGHGEPAETRAGQYLLDKQDVLQRVLEVVKNFEKVDAAKVTPESHFINDLGLDSLDVVEVVMALEQEFILDIPDHDAEKLQSIPEAVEYISQNPMAK